MPLLIACARGRGKRWADKTLQFINKQNRGRPRLLAASLEKVCGGGGGCAELVMRAKFVLLESDQIALLCPLYLSVDK